MILKKIFYCNWALLNTGIPTNGSVPVKALAINGSQIYAGTTDGIFRSTENGSNWTSINTGLSNNNVPAIAVSGTKYLYQYMVMVYMYPKIMGIVGQL
jgi:hypothetical protein